MTEHWKIIEPIFLSAVLMLVGWICFETVNHKTDIAVVKEKVNTIQADISEIKTDIHKMATANIIENHDGLAQKN
jgi:hypothetical protein